MIADSRETLEEIQARKLRRFTEEKGQRREKGTTHWTSVVEPSCQIVCVGNFKTNQITFVYK